MPAKARVDSVDLSSVAQELYSLTPDKFTASRNELGKSVRADGDGELAKRILSLPKPSAAAWAVNLLVRERGDEIDQLLALGNLLREAQDDLDSESLRELSGQRRKLVAALGQQARALAKGAGQAISASTLEDVEQTLQAAMTDPRAAAALRSGRLTRALHAAGLEPVDLAEAVAAPDEGMLDAAPHERAERPHARARVPKRRLSEAKQKAADAAHFADEAASTLAAIDERADELARRRQDLISKVEALKAQVSAVEEEIASTDRDGQLLEREREKATRAVEDARGNADRAQKQVDTLS